MSDRVQTVQEFIDLVIQEAEVLEAGMWISRLKRQIDSLVILFDKPIDRGTLMLLVAGIIEQIKWRLDIIETKALYDSTLEQAHQFLREIYREARQQNIEVELREINRPLVPNEMMVTGD